MTLTDALIESLNQRLPSSAFARLLTTVMPDLVQEPGWDRLAAHLLQTVPASDGPAWAEVLDVLLQQGPVSGWSLPPLMIALRNADPCQAMVQTLWDRLGPVMEAAPFFQMLGLTLQHGWGDLMEAMLTTHAYRDLSSAYTMSSPFYAVRTLDDLNRLIKAGFDLTQATQNRVTGQDTLLQRPVTSFLRERANGTRTFQGAKTLLLERMLADQPQDIVPMVSRLLDLHSEPRELHALLNAIGPAWLDARGRAGGSVVHAVCVRRPTMLPSLLKRPDVRARGLTWSTSPDAQGCHPWELMWLNDWLASSPLPDADSFQAVQAQVKALPEGQAWLDAVPHRPGLTSFDQQITAAIAWGVRLPSFNNDAWWGWMVGQGGFTAQEAWAQVANDPSIQARLDHLIWERSGEHRRTYPESWMNLDLWSDAPHPWLATYRLISSMTLMKPDADAGSVADCQHRMHLDRAIRAINDGADVAQVQRWIDLERLSVDDGLNKVWHRELRTAWERKALHAVFAPTLDVAHEPRRRL